MTNNNGLPSPSSTTESSSTGKKTEGVAANALPPVVEEQKQKPYGWNRLSNPVQHTIASQVAAAIATVSFYPFDVVRMRFMSQDGTKERLHNNRYYTSTSSALRFIARDEGVRTLFRGSHVSVIGVVVSWGVYMWLYRYLEQAFNEYFETAPHLYNASMVSIVSSISAAIVGNPIWMAKTRMQLEAVKQGAGPRYYKTFIGSILHTVRTTGFPSLWRGASAQVLLSIPNAFMLPMYDWLKRQRMATTGKKQLDMWEVAGCSLTAKTSIAVFSHPIILIKTRIMDEKSRVGHVQYKNLAGTALTTIRREGIKGMFRGLTPGLCQSIPRNLMHFVLYETFLHWSAEPSK